MKMAKPETLLVWNCLIFLCTSVYEATPMQNRTEELFLDFELQWEDSSIPLVVVNELNAETPRHHSAKEFIELQFTG